MILFSRLTTRFSGIIPTFLLVAGLSLLPSALSAQQVAQNQRLVVRYKPGVSQLEKNAFRQAFGMTEYRNSRNDGLEVWDMGRSSLISNPVGQNGQLLISDQVSQWADVAVVEPDYPYSFSTHPDDALVSDQWGLHNTGQEDGQPQADIGAFKAWEINKGDASTVIGIVDTGIDYGHEDLAENVWQNLAEDADGDGHTLEYINGSWVLDPGDLDNIDADGNGYVDDLVGWDFINNDNDPFDDHGHGTHVAGIAAAKGNNQVGISGVNWHTKVMALKAFDLTGNGSLSSILPALEYARNMGVCLTNNSWGGSNYSQFLYDEIQLALNQEQLFVAAAGNSGSSLIQRPVYPAAYDLDNIISVGASNRHDQLASFSNFGPVSVDLFAPGQEILSTLPHNQYGYKSGTSMATPMVSGALCLLSSYVSELNALALKDIMLSTVDMKSGFLGRCQTGGRLDIYRMLRAGTTLCVDWVNQSSGMKIKALTEDATYLWAIDDKELVRLKKEDCELDVWDDKNSILPKDKDGKLKALATDQDGYVWIGTDKKGLFRFDGTNWEHYDKKNSPLPDDKINTILVDHENVKWFGTEKKGLARMEDGNWTVYDKKNSGLADSKVKGMEVDFEGNVWLCTHKGLSKFANGQWETFSKKNSNIHEDKLVDVAVDSLGVIWVAGDKGGISTYDQNGWQKFNKGNSGLPDDKVKSIEIDANGVKWLGTKKGLAIFNDSTWIVYKKNNSELNHDAVNAVVMDANTNVWIGTENGVNLFFGEVNVHYRIDGSPCIGETITFENTSIGATGYEWLVNGNSVATSTDFSYTFNDAGIFEFTLVGTNGLVQNVYSAEIHIQALPQVDLGPDLSLCTKAYVLDAGNQQLAYQWSNGNGTVLDSSRYLTVEQSGTYQLSVSDACGNVASDQINLTLSPGCVWPGDVNTDGRVNVLDFLSLGIADGQTGPARVGGGTDWQAYSATNWNNQFNAQFPLGNTANFKHADCDGNGSVELSSDAQVILQNANFPHETISLQDENGAVFNIQPIQNQILGTDSILITYEINLADANGTDLSNFSSLAFTLEYNIPVRSAPTLDFSNSWLGGSESMVMMDANSELNSQMTTTGYRSWLHIAIVRDGVLSPGSGEIAKMGLIVLVEDLAGDDEILAYTSFQLTPQNPILLQQDGSILPVNPILSSLSSSVEIEVMDDGLSSSVEPSQGSIDGLNGQGYRIYPVPAFETVQIDLEGELNIPPRFRLINLYGGTVRVFEPAFARQQYELDLRGIRAGIYLLELEWDHKREIQKIWVTTEDN